MSVEFKITSKKIFGIDSALRYFSVSSSEFSYRFEKVWQRYFLELAAELEDIEKIQDSLRFLKYEKNKERKLKLYKNKIKRSLLLCEKSLSSLDEIYHMIRYWLLLSWERIIDEEPFGEDKIDKYFSNHERTASVVLKFMDLLKKVEKKFGINFVQSQMIYRILSRVYYQLQYKSSKFITKTNVFETIQEISDFYSENIRTLLEVNLRKTRNKLAKILSNQK